MSLSAVMNPNILVKEQLQDRFRTAPEDREGLMIPLMELSEESQHLILGYSGPSQGGRDDLVPYFHVVGHSAEHALIRVFLIAGERPGDTLSTYLLGLFIIAVEDRLRFATGLEITAYPSPYPPLVRHPEAVLKDVWNENHPSALAFQRELSRYDFDLVIHVATEESGISGINVDVCSSIDVQHEVLERYFQSLTDERVTRSFYTENSAVPGNWRFTPIPGKLQQPTEISLNFCHTPGSEPGPDIASGTLLGMLHALRESRENGLW